MNVYKKTGFTMVELMIVVALLAITLAGVLAIFNYSSGLSEFSGSTAIASNEAQFQMEALRSESYATLQGMLGESLFNLQSVVLQGGIGTIYVDELVANELIKIKVVVSWTQKGRVMGEDSNLNGRLDGGEDLNGNGELDSSAQMESVAVNRAF